MIVYVSGVFSALFLFFVGVKGMLSRQTKGCLQNVRGK